MRISTTANLPSVHTPGELIYVTDGGSGSPIVCFSDGTNWKRCDTLGTPSQLIDLTQLPNTLWFDSTDSDNMTIQETNRLKTWSDKNGSGITFTAPFSSNRPTLVTSGGVQVAQGDGASNFMRGDNDADAYMNSVSGFTFIVMMKADNITSTMTPVHFSTDNASSDPRAQFQLAAYAPKVFAQTGDSDPKNSFGVSNDFDRGYVGAVNEHILACVVDFENDSIKVWRDGHLIGEDTTQGFTGTTSSNNSSESSLMGRDSAQLVDGHIRHIVIRNVASTDAEVQQIMNALADQDGGYEGLITRSIVIIGDSIAFSSPDATFPNYPHYKLWVNLGGKSTDLIANEATSGFTFENVLDNISRLNDFNFPSTTSEKIMLLHAGTNNIATLGHTAARAKTDYDDIIEAVGSGITKVASTPIARVGYTETLQQLSELMVALPGTGVTISPLHTLSQFDEESDVNNTTYYKTDKTHPQNAGVDLIVDQWTTTITNL